MTNKKPTNVLVWLNYKNGLRTKMSMSMWDIRKATCSAEIKINKNWIENDDLNYPDQGFSVTFIKLNKKGRLTELELTEKRVGGFYE